jgi:hypothetical protein
MVIIYYFLTFPSKSWRMSWVTWWKYRLDTLCFYRLSVITRLWSHHYAGIQLSVRRSDHIQTGHHTNLTIGTNITSETRINFQIRIFEVTTSILRSTFQWFGVWNECVWFIDKVLKSWREFHLWSPPPHTILLLVILKGPLEDQTDRWFCRLQQWGCPQHPGRSKGMDDQPRVWSALIV